MNNQILNEIRTLNSIEVKYYIHRRLKELITKSINGNNNIIGYHLEVDETNMNNILSDSIKIESNSIWDGYIPLGTKIVYGIAAGHDGYLGNCGTYYHLDTIDYIYEFVKFIKDKEIIDDFDFLDYVLEYIDNYLGIINLNDLSRNQMNCLIMNKNHRFYNPIRKHYLSDFKNKANGMCTEYSIIAQNILSLFEYQTSILYGRFQEYNKQEEYIPSARMHAFNVVLLKDLDGEYKEFLVDFSSPTLVCDINDNYLSKTPYLIRIEDKSPFYKYDFIENELSIKEEMYYYRLIDQNIFKINTDIERIYTGSNNVIIKRKKKGN